ncbi:plasmid recombination protein [Acetobacter pasteurianus]|uniref:plasmid recombination protein n=1 Tax=Acetobacter pasteurianus TaxID=438 RepID=UPI0003FAD687|nr:plasmid recombination protein [Acetobacter pasteurianus]
MSPQFIHLETYARKPDKQGRTVAFVLAEAAREPWACYHVEQPRPPAVLHGVHPSEVRSKHDQRVASIRIQTSTGLRAVRQDQHTILTVVASFHREGRDYEGWERDTLKWLQVRYGVQLASVIRHTDESHPHLHAYVLPEDPDMRARRLHPGALAKDTALQNGATNRAGDAAYRAAMRDLQDTYWLEVCAALGIRRFGFSRRRMTRAEWHKEKVVRECGRAADAKLGEDMQRIKAAEAELAKWQQDLEQWRLQMMGDRDRIRKEAAQQTEALYRTRMEDLVQRHDEERALRVELQRRLEAFLPKAEADWLFPS